MKDWIVTCVIVFLLYIFAFIAVPVIAYELVVKGSDRYLDDNDTATLMAFGFWGGIEITILLSFAIDWWFA